MPIDPNTGAWTNDVSYQPSGAMGAVISLLNAQKTGEIARTLQQQRAAQAQHEADQQEQYALAAQRAQSGREAQAAMPPGTSWDDRITASLPYENFKDVLPYARASELGKSRENVASTLATGKENVENIKQGVTGAPLPTSRVGVNEAKAGNLNANTDKTNAETTEIPANSEAKRKLQAAQAAYYQVKQAASSKASLTDQEAKSLATRLNAIDAELGKYMRADHGMLSEDPNVAAQIEQLKADRANIQKLIEAKRASNAKKPVEKGESMFAPGTFDTTSTPAGGSTTAPGGSSSPAGTVTRSIVLPSP
jgi:hypothetical protein